jgi:hypothetical protein
MFELRSLDGISRTIVATEAIKAGTVIHSEEPLMDLTPGFLRQFDATCMKGAEKLVAAISYFQNLMTAEQQEKYLGLPGGSFDSPRAERFLQFAEMLAKDDKPPDEEQRKLFARITMIATSNAFGSENDVQVFEVASRFSHSCESNCSYHIEGSRITVRAIVTIRAGEELTLDYNAEFRLEPTDVRRSRWLEVKDSTCHCPRCEASGDDTRQFRCFDPKCTGRHYPCQPISSALLPCTVCQRAPHLVYQAAMFLQEKQWMAMLRRFPRIPRTPTLCSSVHRDQHGKMITFDEPAGMVHTEAIPVLLLQLEGLPYHLCHAVGFQLAHHELRCRLKLARLGQSNHRTRLQHLVTEMEPMLNIFYAAPRKEVGTLLIDIQAVYYYLGDPGNAVRILKRLLRTERILKGRDTASPVEKFVGALSAATMEGCCACCEEFPERAAMTLSRCGACKKVVYCGKACQKAHWKVHKAQCKK